MGPGDYVCVTLRGGAPWGLTLEEGEGDTFLVTQVECGGPALEAGVQESDEVVSINGEPCSSLPQALGLMESSIGSLQLVMKRCHWTASKDLEAEAGRVSPGGTSESTSLHIFTLPSRSEIPKEAYVSESQGETCHELGIFAPKSSSGGLELVDDEKQRKCFSPGDMVELQVLLSEQSLDDQQSSLPGFEDREHDKNNSSPNVLSPNKEPLEQHGATAGDAPEVTLRQPQAARTGRGDLTVGGASVRESFGCHDGEKGVEHSEDVSSSFTISFEIPLEDVTPTEEQDSDSEADQEKPNKHRAKHARLRRNESLSEKQVKETKSKCKRIALLLSAAPANPNNKGLLMFKKHRQRAKKYTLVSYGTGEDEPEFSEEEDNLNGNQLQGNPSGDFIFIATTDCDSKKPFLIDDPSSKGVLSLSLDKSLLKNSNKSKQQADMECLPETKGKGVLMFAQRRLRMDEISADHEELRRQGLPVEAIQETEKKVAEQSYMQSAIEGHAYMDVNMHQQSQRQYQQYQEQQYYEQQQNYQQQQYQQYQQQQYEQRQYQQQQLYQQQHYHQDQQQIQHYSSNINGTIQQQSEEIQNSLTNRTAKPITAASTVGTPYSYGVNEINQDSVGQGEQIASRDERISTPAVRTGLLLDTRKRNTSKPMFTFKEAPKVSPNPALLNLLNRSDKKGLESGPEEDYLSLGAEACNFLQSQRVKNKVPPPVAPKPVINPISPLWSAQMEAVNQNMPQGAENSLSTPAVGSTVETVPAPEQEPALEPPPESSAQSAPQEAPVNAGTSEQQQWTHPEPESEHQSQQVTVQDANTQVNSSLQAETSHMSTWEAVKTQEQTTSCSWNSAQVQPQNPPASQSSPQPPWVTRLPAQSQPVPQLTTNNWNPQNQPTWSQVEQQGQEQVNPQPPWTHLQQQPQVQPAWIHMKEKPQFQQTWPQPQEPVQPQPQNQLSQWTQPAQSEQQQQPPWICQPQQKAQVLPPWVQEAQPEAQPQPPWVQQPQQHQSFPQTWPKVQTPGQPQPPWIQGQPGQQQPSNNAWPQTQAQTPPPWMNIAQGQPQPQTPVSLNPWAPVPAHVQAQPPWAQHPPEHDGQQHVDSWAQQNISAQQNQQPWAQSVVSQPPPQQNWQQSNANLPQQPQTNAWPSGQAQPQTPENDWRQQPQQTPLNVSMRTITTNPSPKLWHPQQNAPQNQNPPPPPRRMHSFTVGQRESSPVNPMATVLNPKSSPGPAFEMPIVKGKGADMFAKRQSRMEKYVVDSETVEANKASRSTSPAASLPNEWKYTPNVRAPPPRAYNPIQSPFYPLAASKQAPTSSPTNKAKKKEEEKPKPTPKPLNVIDVMKHQPYKLDSSLFIFGPGVEAAKPPPPKPNSPPSSVPDSQIMRYEQLAPVQETGPYSPPYNPQAYGIPMQPAMHESLYQQNQANVYSYQQVPAGPYQQEYNLHYQQPIPPPYQPPAPQPLNHQYQQAAYQPANSPPYMATPSIPYTPQPTSSYTAPSFLLAARPESASGGGTGTAPKPKFTANKSSAQVWKPTAAEKE